MKRTISTAAMVLCALLATLLAGVLPASAAPPGEPAIPIAAGRESTEDGLLLDGITYVAFRAFAEFADNCEVRWDPVTKTATAVKQDGTTVTATAGEKVLRLDARRFYTAGPIRILNDRMYVPIRPLARCFGIEVDWSVQSRSVSLARSGERVRTDEGVYAADDLYWLSRIIYAEAGGESFDGMVAVGNVVLNRVAHPDYPSTVRGVIFDRKYGVQFTPVANGTVYRTPSKAAVEAAKVCLEGDTLSKDILYFFNPTTSSSSWVANNRTYAFRLGHHVFYK